MSSFDIVHIPQCSRREVDEIFEYFTHEFHALKDVKVADAPAIAAKIYHKAEVARRCALACIIDYADFTQYALTVGEFCALVELLQDILRH